MVATCLYKDICCKRSIKIVVLLLDIVNIMSQSYTCFTTAQKHKEMALWRRDNCAKHSQQRAHCALLTANLHGF